jgi:hypothetical protein
MGVSSDDTEVLERQDLFIADTGDQHFRRP